MIILVLVNGILKFKNNDAWYKMKVEIVKRKFWL